MSIAASAKAIALASLASRALGFVRLTLLVFAIGGTSASVGGQTFDVANSIPTNLYGLIAGGVLGAVIVPQVVRAILDGDHGQERLDRLLTITIGGALLVATLATIAAPALVFLYASGWSRQWLALSAAMAYWCLPQIFFYIVYAVLAQILNAKSVFGWPAWAPAIANFVSIIGVIAFLAFLPSGLGGPESWSAFMIAVLCGISTLSIAIQAAVLIRPLRLVGFRFRPRFGINGLGQVGKVASWTFFGVAAGQLAFVVLSNVATRAGEALHLQGIDGAGLNSFGYAYLLVFLPHGVATVSLATAMFPRLSRFAATRDIRAVARDIARTSTTVAFICFGAMAILVVTAPLITTFLWNTAIIGGVLQPLSLGLLGLSQTYVLSRGLFAFHDGHGPFLAQLAAAIVATIGSILAGTLLPAQWVVIGIACCVALSNIVSWIVASLRLRSRLFREGSELAEFFIGRRRFFILFSSFLLATVLGFVALATLGTISEISKIQQGIDLTIVVAVIAVSFVLTVVTLDRRDGWRHYLRVD